MEMAAERPLPPSSELLSASSVWTWVDAMPEGLGAFLLITPPMGPVVDMQALAEQAGLSAPDQPMAHSTVQLTIHGPDAVVAVRGTELALRVPMGSEWSQIVRTGGTLVVVVGAEPLLSTSGRQEVDDYLLGAVLPRRIWMGKTRVAAEFTEAQIEGRACRKCGSERAPLHPDEVIREIVSVLCTRCLVASR